jgi:IclR family pca regulon transcriptional regulator
MSLAKDRTVGRQEKSPAKEQTDIDPRYIVPGLARGLALLQLFKRKNPAQTLAQLAAGLGLSRSATYRLVYTLEKEGFIAREPGGRLYRVTSEILTLGFEYLNSRGIHGLAEPVLADLSDATSAAAHLVILDRWRAVYVARAVPSVVLVSNLQIGERHPAHVTASGRVLLAHQSPSRLQDIHKAMKRECRTAPVPSLDELMAEARQDHQRGYVHHRSILSSGVVSLACPVRDREGKVTAAITLIAPDQAFASLGGEKSVRTKVAAAAETISKKLGFNAR